MQGVALLSSINPNPFFIRRGFNLIPKPLCPLQGRGLTDSEGDPLHQSFGMALEPLPLRGSPFFPKSLLSPHLVSYLLLILFSDALVLFNFLLEHACKDS